MRFSIQYIFFFVKYSLSCPEIVTSENWSSFCLMKDIPLVGLLEQETQFNKSDHRSDVYLNWAEP